MYMEKASNCNIENLSLFDIARLTSQESYMQAVNRILCKDNRKEDLMVS